MSRTDDIADLRDDMDRVAQRFDSAAAAAAGPSTGSDESGAVTVTITDEGHLKDVRVQMDWTTRVDPEALGGAVLAATAAASAARFEAWGTALAAPTATAPQVRPLPPVSESFGARLEEVMERSGSPDETRHRMEQMVEIVREIRASVVEAKAGLAALQATEVIGENPKGGVEVVLSALGQLKEVRYDDAWLDRTHPTNIGRDTLLAFQDALRSVAHDGAQAAMAATRLGQLQALVNDPEALARHLRG